VVDCDWGCGVIDTRGARDRGQLELPPELEYERDFIRLKEFAVNEAEFLELSLKV
jgi:hypothetical protein